MPAEASMADAALTCKLNSHTHTRTHHPATPPIFATEHTHSTHPIFSTPLAVLLASNVFRPRRMPSEETCYHM